MPLTRFAAGLLVGFILGAAAIAAARDHSTNERTTTHEHP